MDLVVRRIEQDEGFAVGVETEQPAGRFGADQEMPVAFNCQGNRMRRLGLVENRALAIRRDFVDDALVTSGGEDVACLIDGETQMYLSGGSKSTDDLPAASIL